MYVCISKKMFNASNNKQESKKSQPVDKVTYVLFLGLEIIGLAPQSSVNAS